MEKYHSAIEDRSVTLHCSIPFVCGKCDHLSWIHGGEKGIVLPKQLSTEDGNKISCRREKDSITSTLHIKNAAAIYQGHYTCRFQRHEEGEAAMVTTFLEVHGE